ncbi:hypothetical protein EHW99_0419 [Erwinia amylovora]|uniref:Uncharacterized protein n=2 Tax=Erwinia amylovora TaxID=552 RepID=A0A831A3V6_ERWAM|nr:hypothetical protein EaACW_3217 [Erwinia amylovora ACW56400]QJQ53126.1 hypothetical protein EHX00_0419 [Erwinia amylovora]CBA23200.1 hypothetical protein predicted by Glimmer/Critica [Erwinia amylovora CFBP1430]CCO80056.1 hypothetical protein BN432_3286 [Erwinia amylovora Ea356]CCO83860.1 hypothetical protein BN433_3312 [Erwinia amylovora Ea266]CCO87623.1 hypothetical protein BN434_3263 [Erwinia amylovora CFBP 2585]CCO91415.1 hypothetical protein BN435_3272 [Erwinia amylovora 01SFR-BO]CCO
MIPKSSDAERMYLILHDNDPGYCHARQEYIS